MELEKSQIAPKQLGSIVPAPSSQDQYAQHLMVVILPGVAITNQKVLLFYFFCSSLQAKWGFQYH
jgi:hypothetical protein